jgi:hypothetical protein
MDTTYIANFLPTNLVLALGTPAWNISGFNLKLFGPTGASYRIEASTNFLNWLTLTSFLSTNSPSSFNDPGATNYRQRFYRAVWLP